MAFNLLNGLLVHYDCEGTAGLLSSTTFPEGAPTTNFTEQNTVALVDPGKFGTARGPCSGTFGSGGDGFSKTIAANGPWDWRGGSISMSVGTWVYLDSAAGGQILYEHSGTAENQRAWALRAVHDLGGGATSPVVFFRDNTAGNWNFAFAVPQDQSGIAGGQATGEWVYMGLSFDAGTKFASLYYGSPTDGEHYSSFDASAINGGAGPFDGWSSLSDPLVVGTNRGTASSVGSAGLSGDIDHIDVWNRALTQLEWSYLFNGGAGRETSEYVQNLAPGPLPLRAAAASYRRAAARNSLNQRVYLDAAKRRT